MFPKTDDDRGILAAKLLRFLKNQQEDLPDYLNSSLLMLQNTSQRLRKLLIERRTNHSQLTKARITREQAFKKLRAVVRLIWNEVRSRSYMPEFHGERLLFHNNRGSFLPEGQGPSAWLDAAEATISGMERSQANDYPALHYEPADVTEPHQDLVSADSNHYVHHIQMLLLTQDLKEVREDLHLVFRIVYESMRLYMRRKYGKNYHKHMRLYGFPPRQKTAKTKDPSTEADEVIESSAEQH